jgi:hypothetical protein
MRDGNWKYLRIAGNEFLFDVVQDRASEPNLKDRRKPIFDRLKSDWDAWNGTMQEGHSRPANYFPPGKSIGLSLWRGGTLHPQPRRPVCPTK